MLNDVLSNEKFVHLMKMHVYECVEFLLQSGTDFAVVANLELTRFNPPLPDEIRANFTHPAIVFALGGYTFESAQLTQDTLIFEAGFGANDFASVVSIDLSGIVQIMLEDNAIMINFAIAKPKQECKRSISVFKSNPKNSAVLNKKQ